MIAGRLVVSWCDLSEVLELVEEPLDEIAPSIELGIDGTLNLEVALRGNMAPPAMGRNQIEEGAGVIPAIGDDIAGRAMGREEIADGRPR